MQVWFLGQEDHLEEGIATHSSLLVWRVPIDRGAWQATVHRSQRVRHNWSILACTQANKNIKLKCYYKTDKVILTYVMCCRRLLRVPWIARRSNQSSLMEISPGLFIGRTDAEPETPILWPPHVKSWFIGIRLWCWEGLAAAAEGDNRGWDGWMASQTRWTWVWVNSGSWWWTGRPVMLRFIRLQRVERDWATELNWTDWYKLWLLSHM